MSAFGAYFPNVNNSAGGLTPPEGFAFVVDGEGNYVVDEDDAYIVTEI